MWTMVVWLACKGGEGDGATRGDDDDVTEETGAVTTDTDTDTDAHTGTVAHTGAPTTTGDTGPTTSPPAQVIAASCTPHPVHPLVVSCTAELDREGTAQVVLTAATAAERRFSGEGTTVELLVWGLEADTPYSWSLGGFSGVVTTGSLPLPLTGADFRVQGGPFLDGVDGVLVPLGCGSRYFVVVGDEGDILWYADGDLYVYQMHGYAWVDDPPALLSLNERTFVETDLLGQEVHRSTNFRGTLHHDAAAWGPYRYTLFRDNVGRFEVDGVHVWENGQVIGTFFLGDHYPVVSGPSDWSHANGVKVADDGTVTISMLQFDSVLAVNGDPASPTFLEPVFLVDGTGRGSLAPGDYVPVSADPLEGFSGQHNASLHDGDELWLFDNDGAGDGSRAVRFLLQSGSGTFAHDASWDLGVTCRIQGGAVPVEGGVLVTCATTGDVSLMQEGSAAPVWSMSPTCSGGGPFPVLPTHAIPVAIGD